MLTVPLVIAEQLAKTTPNLSTCAKITRTDGEIFRITEHGQPITIAGDGTYLSVSGYDPTALASGSDLSVDNAELDVLATDDSIIEPDVIAGLWDYARVERFLVCPASPDAGTLKLPGGFIGQIKPGIVRTTAETRGLWQALQQRIVDVTTMLCRNNLGDAGCRGGDLSGPDMADHTFSGTVASVTSAQRRFTDATLSNDEGRFENGTVTFTSGANDGLAKEVRTHLALSPGADITVKEPFPYEIQVGDTFTVTHGCKKRFEEDCIAIYDNAKNNRSEDLPGNDALMRGGG